MIVIIDSLNTILWNYLLVYGLLAIGLYFTVRLGFFQFLHFGEMLRSMRGTREDQSGISPFQALMVSLASRVGTGNLAGVAVALYLGGAGAIFWMWVVALLGMATAYAESSLAQLYKVRNEEDQYRGGPAFYIARGLNARRAGCAFSICLALSFGLVFNAVQANSIADAMEGAFGASKILVGVVLAILSAMIIFGGIRQIARVAEIVVPFMAIGYLLLAVYVLIVNIGQVPAILGQILSSAFGLDQAAGGVTGGIAAAMLNGVKRGLFSNEAGMGSAPNIAAVATTSHPSSQGFVQALGVFIDTIVICTATAVMILLSGTLEPGSGVTGTQLTQNAMSAHIGATGTYFIALAVFFFAFTSIIGNYAYAESGLSFLGASTGMPILALRVLATAMVVWGAYANVSTVFEAADISMAFMAIINLVAIILLSGTVVKLTKDYFAQKRSGQIPAFDPAAYPELEGKIDRDIWSQSFLKERQELDERAAGSLASTLH
ncbi:sodium:alanine symporter family protein [Chelativorans sp. Marseille-P2723]|uniref:alanine/glycine:cation symporter family protein n=1 Tax=Chelativorans sp. Marseille-P2723 TaxID=2709133 RepID=UPI0015710F22|nr:sodium:alanine symporter family protein [Chelativorans sp. Marseille-P2723]